MTRIRLLALALAALLAAPLAFLTPQPADAGVVMMCQGDVSGASTGSRTITVTSSTATPQPLYTLNSAGCANIALADIGFFLSQGFSQPGPVQTALFNTGVWTGTTSFQAATLPANAYIQQIVMFNSTANAVTGGVAVGTTANGADVVAAQAVAANALTFTTDALTLKRVFSTTAAQPIFVSPVTAGNNANVTVTIVYGLF